MKNHTIKELANAPGFFRELSDSMIDAICVVNEDLEVVHYNEAFALMFGKGKSPILGEKFGATIGCGQHKQEVFEGICSNCKLRLSMLATIQTGENQEKESVVLEMENSTREDVRLINFQSNYMEYQGEKFAVVIMSDLTNMGKETLSFINKFYSTAMD